MALFDVARTNIFSLIVEDDGSGNIKERYNNSVFVTLDDEILGEGGHVFLSNIPRLTYSLSG